jgi:hypothetical protein
VTEGKVNLAKALCFSLGGIHFKLIISETFKPDFNGGYRVIRAFYFEYQVQVK